jgi:geranylgeranyl diphosphate synthase type I
VNPSRSSQRLTDLAREAPVAAVHAFPALRLAETPGSPALSDAAQFGSWHMSLRRAVLDRVADFVATRCADELGACGHEIGDAAADILVKFVDGGKCLRSTFMYLGWLCGAPASDAALSATASLELLHAFALLQDDVMDDSASRRGRPAAHLQFADWHSERGLSGSSRRFGESAAILLGDLCLIWAEQMLRDSGLQRRHLAAVWPRYDAMRTELAVGQFAELAIDVRELPTLEAVLEVARRKSGNYTVRRPLEIGAAMAGCDDRVLAALGDYGSAIGEAFQMRDDILGIFGSPAATGKPNKDLLERKATSVVVAAHQLADGSARRQLRELMASDRLDEAALDGWRTLIVATGAVQCIEELITSRVQEARNALDRSMIGHPVMAALLDMAGLCTERAA